MAREKAVVREEIASYEDNPEEKVHDVLAATVWGAHPLGRPILGTRRPSSALDRSTAAALLPRPLPAAELVVSRSPARSTTTVWLEHCRAAGASRRRRASRPRWRSPRRRSRRARRSPTRAATCTQLYLALARPGVANDHPTATRLAVLNALSAAA